MEYKIQQTHEAINDIGKLAEYMSIDLKKTEAAYDFLDFCEKQISSLKPFPFGYRGISIEYKGYEIRLKPFNSYNIFFIVNTAEQTVIILKVLKNRQNWLHIIGGRKEYRL